MGKAAVAERPKTRYQRWKEENPEQAEEYAEKRRSLTLNAHAYSEAGRAALERPEGWRMVMSYAAWYPYIEGTVNTMALSVYLAEREYAAKQAGEDYARPTDLRSFAAWKAAGRMVLKANRPEQPDGIGWRPNTRRVTVEENGDTVKKDVFLGKFTGFELWDVSRTTPWGKQGAENPEAPTLPDRTRPTADIARVLAGELGEKVKARPSAADAVRLLVKAAGGEVEVPELEDGPEIEPDEELGAQLGGSVAYVAGLILGLPVGDCPWPAALQGLMGPRESALSIAARQVMTAGRGLASRVAALVDQAG